MEKFTIHTGLAAPLDRENVDTDAIIPKQFLKSIKRTGFGPPTAPKRIASADFATSSVARGSGSP